MARKESSGSRAKLLLNMNRMACHGELTGFLVFVSTKGFGRVGRER
jgi:hypothetical protein